MNAGNAPNFTNYMPQQPPQFQQPAMAPQLQHHQQMMGSPPGYVVQGGGQYQPYPNPAMVGVAGGGQVQQHQQQLQQQQQAPFAHQPQIQNVFASPIITPANNPQTFQSNQLSSSNNNNGVNSRTGPQLGQGVVGADLLTRILMGLRSGIQSEEDWALAALMQVSFNSPQACNLQVQSTLANTVLKRIYSRCVEANDRAKTEKPDGKPENALDVPTLTGKTLKEQQKVLEALLVLRNTSLDTENAQFLAESKLCRYIVIHGLSLPDLRVYSEFKHLCLEIVEAISIHVKISSADDDLFAAVVGVLSDGCTDRSVIAPALRSLARLLIHDENNATKGLEPSFIIQILRILLIDDDELITAALDFLYQYTQHISNVSTLLKLTGNIEMVTKHLVRLLTFGMAKPSPEYVRLPRLTPKAVPSGPPVIPAEILDRLLKLPEPERATHWIRSSYEYDSTGEVTQISLWKAYESQFEAHSRTPSGARLLPAVDFIKNVTSAFQNSAAMVVNLADGQKKFIIKGIVARQFAVDPDTLPPAANSTSSSSSSAAQKQQNGGAAPRGPPAFDITVALVMQNIARNKDGKTLLRSNTLDLIEAGLLNPHVQSYTQEIIELLDSHVENQDVVADEKTINGNGNGNGN